VKRLLAGLALALVVVSTRVTAQPPSPDFAAIGPLVDDAIARRELPGARLLLGFRVFVGRGRLLLRGGGRYESRHRRRDHSDGERDSKHDFVHEFTSLYFHGAAPAGRQSASVRNLKSG